MGKRVKTYKESASYTKIKITLHKTLHSFPFRKLQVAIESLKPALDPCHRRGLSKPGTVNYDRGKRHDARNFAGLSSINRFEFLICF